MISQARESASHTTNQIKYARCGSSVAKKLEFWNYNRDYFNSKNPRSWDVQFGKSIDFSRHFLFESLFSFSRASLSLSLSIYLSSLSLNEPGDIKAQESAVTITGDDNNKSWVKWERERASVVGSHQTPS